MTICIYWGKIAIFHCLYIASGSKSAQKYCVCFNEFAEGHFCTAIYNEFCLSAKMRRADSQLFFGFPSSAYTSSKFTITVRMILHQVTHFFHFSHGACRNARLGATSPTDTRNVNIPTPLHPTTQYCRLASTSMTTAQRRSA